MKKIISGVVTIVVVLGIVFCFIWFRNWPMRFHSKLDDFFGKDNWEYISGENKRSMVYSVYRKNHSNPASSDHHPGRYKDWNISFINRYGEEELWTISNHIYKINHHDYRYKWFHPNRFSAKQALTRELMEVSFSLVGDEVMNEIILDVLTEEEASCMEIRMSYEGGNPKPKVYSKLMKQPWFKANEITVKDYLETDIYDFHLYIRVHDYRLEKLTEEQRQHVLNSFEVIQEKLQEAYGEDTAYEMFWGDGRYAEVK